MGQRKACLGSPVLDVKRFFMTMKIDVFAWPFKGLPVPKMNTEKAVFQ